MAFHSDIKMADIAATAHVDHNLFPFAAQGDARTLAEQYGMAHPEEPFSLYLHIPFCEKKCPYCDFNTYAGMQTSFDDTVDALRAEMQRWSPLLRARPVRTIFMGGGTPTVLDAAQLERLFATLHECFTLLPNCEITSEANPGTVDRAKFGVLHDLGVNRLSLGVQSFQAHELQFLGRIHNVPDVYQAVESARDAGFTNINLDFMFGLPHQRTQDWENTLEQALALEPQHLSLYSLIVEENTPLHHWVQIGRVDAPDDDVAAELYEMAMARMAADGYTHYEVSNWARNTATDGAQADDTQADDTQADEGALPALASQHNLVYWQNGEYLGIGPGSHSHLRLLNADGAAQSQRWSNRKPVPSYVNRILQGRPLHEFHESLPATVAMGETMMLGLRLIRHGVPFAHFSHLHNCDPRIIYEAEIAALTAQELVLLTKQRIRLTERGLLLGNQVFERFIA